MTDNTESKIARVPRDSVLDPRKPLLAQPFKRMVEEGMCNISVIFTSLGFQATGEPLGPLLELNVGLKANEQYPVVKLLQVAEGAKLLERGAKKKSKTGGGAQPLPAKSLCKRDFEGTTNEQLLNRASAVATAANGGTLTGRARQSGAFNGTVTTSFQDWWDAATARERASSLCQSKELAKLSDADINRLGGRMPCPFRGTASFLVSQDDDAEQEEQAPPVPEHQVRAPTTPPKGGEAGTPEKKKTPSPKGKGGST